MFRMEYSIINIVFINLKHFMSNNSIKSFLKKLSLLWTLHVYKLKLGTWTNVQ